MAIVGSHTHALAALMYAKIVAGVLVTAVVAALLLMAIDPDAVSTNGSADFGVALYWAIVSLGSVGYGDVLATNVAGRALVGLVVFVPFPGLLILTAVCASTFILAPGGGSGPCEVTSQQSTILPQNEVSSGDGNSAALTTSATISPIVESTSLEAALEAPLLVSLAPPLRRRWVVLTATSILLTWGLLVAIIFAALAMAICADAFCSEGEPDQCDDPNFGMALYWSLATFNTVGYGDVNPSYSHSAPAAGRALCIVYILLNTPMYPIFCAYVAAEFVVTKQPREEAPELEMRVLSS